MNLWMLMVAIGALTYCIRGSLILTSGRIVLPKPLERGLRFVPPAVLTALIAPQFLVLEGQFSLSPGNPRLVAGIVAAVVAGWTRNMLATIAAGMSALWLLQYLFS